MKKSLFSLILICLACFGVANAQTLNEGFEGTTFPPTDWTTIHVSGTNAWARSTGTGANSSSAFAYRKDVSGGYEDYLITPLLEPKSGEELSFYLASQYSASYPGTTLTIEVSTTTPTVAAFTTVLATYTSGSSGTFETTGATDWVNKTVGLSAYVGQQIYIAFHAKDTGYNADTRIDNVSGVSLYLPPCPKPTNLEATTDGATATLTWDGTAANGFNIEINGALAATGQTSPYTFNVALSTTYNVTVTADCDANGTSDPVSTSFTTPACVGGRTINYTLTDSYGDGWNGASITIIEGCEQTSLTLGSGSSTSGTLTICEDYFAFVWNTGSYDSECGFTFTEGGTTLFTKPSSLSNGLVLYTQGTQLAIPTDLTAGTPGIDAVDLTWTAGGNEIAWQLCVNDDETNLILVEGRPSYTLTRLNPDTDYSVKVRAYIDADTQSCWSDEETFTTAVACAKPTDLAEANIGINSADLSWSGEASSYVVEYRPWHQVGEDQVATAVLTSYTFDLSEYSGTGSVAIRHYDVSDMFMLNVDDIVVTNANGQTIYSQNFEAGTMPSNITNMDLDGDGNVWGIRTNADDDFGNPSGNGTYCVSSASWIQGVGAVYPDNWMIISNIELGGQITFIARGQDPEWASENFAVYVSAEADMVEETVSGTTYPAINLTPNTPYAWQVKSDCGDYQSTPVASFFKTKDDMLVFATAGNWNVVANWKDAEGNTATALPTVDNNVRIDAAAVIPTGVVAEANKVTINGGSITIKDGGQLKQSSATVKVTMEKEIAAVGEDNWNSDNNSGYYFIASPFSGRTLYDEDTDWNHVEDMLTDDDYDLYAFDATADLEWINYKSNPTHISFQSSNGNAGLMGGEGYLYASKEGTTIKFVGSTGKSNNYSETKDFTFNGTSTDDFNGWALVGNFFSCNAYINYVDADGDALEADFYTMDPTNGYTLSSSNVALAPCTGAFINYSDTGKVQFATEAPATSKRAGILNMNVSRGNKNLSQARVRFGQGHNLGSMSFRNDSKLYMPVDGNDYAVVYSENQGEMPINFKAAETGTYTISFNTENVEFGYLHLLDNMTGNDVDLLSTPSYSFEANTTDYASRFRLVFSSNNANEGSFAFINNGEIILSGVNNNSTVNVYDVTGRMISSANGANRISTENMSAGVYMIQLVNGVNVMTQKIVVK